VSSHVAVGLGSGPDARVIDFSRALSLWRETIDWKLAAYQSISDVEAVALYYSNLAVDRMLAGDTEDAERLFRFWMGRAPAIAELHNNLAVLLNRRGRHHEALSLLERAIGAFPTFKPLYTNAMAAARGAGRPALAQELARRGEELEHDDPFFLVAHALTHYQERAYGEAARELERARSTKPDSPVILAWLTRAYLRAGERERGAAAFEAVQRLAPGARLVRDLEAQFPELRPRDAPARVD
jgi:Tfp pilus assembly protein PilF